MSYGYVTPTGGFTLECWFSHSTATTWAECFFNQQTQNRSVSWSSNVQVNGRQILVYLESGTGLLRIDWHKEDGTTLLTWADSDASYATDGAWHHLVVRMLADQRLFDVWLDGEQRTVTRLTSAIDWKPGVMSIGAAYAPHLGNFGYYMFKGGLAYAAVYDLALSAARIAEHYAAGNGGTVFYGDDEVTRLSRIFDFCSVPVDARRYDDALTTLQGVQISGQSGLDKALATAKDASGLVYADGQGTLVYQNRRHRYNRPLVATLSDSNGSAPDVGMTFSTDDTKVYNDVRASRPYGGKARLRNKSSEYEYGQRVYTLEIAVTDDDEMRNAGTWVAERYGEDLVRISGVTLAAESSADIEELVATVSIGDRVAFDELPENAPQTYAEYIVEGISVQADFKAETWSLGLELSPAELWDVFQVGVSTLGDGSRIAF